MPAVAVTFIITIIISIIIAFLIIQLTKSSWQADAAFDKKDKEKKYLSTDDFTGQPLRENIFKELSESVGSSRRAEELSRKISEIFDKELENKVNGEIGEVKKKYDSIIREKIQNEEVAWKKYNKTLKEKKETEAVIRSIAEGLVVVDDKGKVVMMNPAAERLLGVSKTNKIGKHITENLGAEQLLSLAKSSEDKEDKEIELISKQDETKKVLRASTAVVENEDGLTVGMVSVLSDITKQKELDQLKSNFVANVSHELRTPLVAMEKSISLILSKAAGSLSETQEQFLSIADRNLKRLTLLINDLLDLSKLEAGKMGLRAALSSVEKVIDEAIDGLMIWANAKSINVEKKIQEGLPEVNMDPDRIIQALNNLIGNAIKFTPKNGKILVEAVLNRDKERLEVSVSDTGIGIATEDLPKLFNKFYQVGERVPTDIGGTGIGLCVAKEVVELHGGKIWAESEKDCGAKFTFTLPLSDNIQKTGG